MIPLTFSNSIDQPFAVQVQAPGQPFDRQNVTFTPNSEDRLLFLSPDGSPVSNFTLQGGVWTNAGLHAVVSGQIQADNTTTIFFTTRVQKLAALDAYFGCEPDTDGLQVQFRLSDGASACIALDGVKYSLKYKPAGDVGKVPESVTLIGAGDSVNVTKLLQ